MNMRKSRVSKAQDKLQTALDSLMGKYDSDESTISVPNMSDQDQELYLALDNAIQLMLEISSAVDDTVIEV
tara:strand:- start:774 stop:986 length:213 start_codon:yes stop_codon:yes gene_type:complete